MTDLEELKSLNNDAQKIRRQIIEGVSPEKEEALNKELNMILKRTYKLRRRME